MIETEANGLARLSRERIQTTDRARHCAMHSRALMHELAAAPLNLDPDQREVIETTLRLVLHDTLRIGVDLGIDILSPPN